MAIKTYNSFTHLGREKWNHLNSNRSPFLNFNYLYSLEKSSSVGIRSGWNPKVFYQDEPSKQGLLYSFAKSHSYGEYIFDWAWANTYAQYNMPYYPKLTSMIPFTPASTSHFIMPEFDEDVAGELLENYDEYYLSQNYYSSHFLFLTEREKTVFQEKKYILRDSFQYHFFNEDYKSFEDFLLGLKNKRAKQIRKERRVPEGVVIQSFSGESLTVAHASEMYQFYLSNIDNKNAIDYLQESFFEMVFKSMAKNILYVRASKGEALIAGAMYFYDDKTLYGRYWGCHDFYPNLHFEMCYYQGIEFCINNKLEVFEAGAQGEHKIARGFRPVRTYSAHKLKNVSFQQAIDVYIKSEKEQIDRTIDYLNCRLPFKGA